MKRFIKKNLFDISEQCINYINNELFRNIIFLIYLNYFKFTIEIKFILIQSGLDFIILLMK